MKKYLIALSLTLAATIAGAVEVGVQVGRNTGADLNATGLTIGQKFGSFGIEGAYTRSLNRDVNVNRYSVVGSYDLLTVANTTISAKAGAARIEPSFGPSGYAATAGIGASYPVTKNVSLTADYSYQKGQKRINGFDGNIFTVGAKYSF